jgi:hypothetical protein
MPHEMLFTLKDVRDRFEEVVNAWFRVADELREVCDVFFSTHYRSLYLEHRFSNMAQAAEGYHRASPRFGNTVIPEDDHKRRIEAILTNCPEEYRNWLREKVAWSNEPSLRRRLKDLCAYVFEIANPLVGDVKEFVNAVVEARNQLTHPQSRENKPKTQRLYLLSRQLGSLMEACFLRELGLPLDAVYRQADYKVEVQR